MSALLLTYATTYGSTREVAEVIAEVLRERGLTVTLEAMPNVSSFEAYDTVVMGVPIYAHKLHKQAQEFLAQHQAALTAREVALFTLGPIMLDTAEAWKGARKQLDKDLAHYRWLRLAALEMFGGKFDPKILRMPEKLFMGAFAPSDLRDWDVIRAWANALPEQLRVTG